MKKLARIVVCGSYSKMDVMEDIVDRFGGYDNIDVIIPDPDFEGTLLDKRLEWLRMMDSADIIIGIKKAMLTNNDYGESTSYEMAYAIHTGKIWFNMVEVDGSYNFNLQIIEEYMKRQGIL